MKLHGEEILIDTHTIHRFKSLALLRDVVFGLVFRYFQHVKLYVCDVEVLRARFGDLRLAQHPEPESPQLSAAGLPWSSPGA